MLRKGVLICGGSIRGGLIGGEIWYPFTPLTCAHINLLLSFKLIFSVRIRFLSIKPINKFSFPLNLIDIYAGMYSAMV